MRDTGWLVQRATWAGSMMWHSMLHNLRGTIRHVAILVAIAMAATLCIADSVLSSPKTFYVSAKGDDSNPGSFVAPFKSIGKGASVLGPGDTLFVRGGIYNEAVTIVNSGTASAPIVISAYQAELPVIDGQGRLPEKQGAALVSLKGNYIRMEGFEVRNSNSFNSPGIVIDGVHNTVSHMNVHHHYACGVLARGDYSVVEYSTIWENAYRNCRAKGCAATPYPNGGWATGVSAARSPVDGITKHAILRHNVVYNNWGEGLSTFEAQGTVMEDNVVYDNWTTNTYISDASDVVFQRNLIYTTSESAVGTREGVRKACITLADERKDKPRSANNTVRNNVCLNGDLSIFAWTLVPNSGLVNNLIANNTVVNGMLKTGSLNINSKIVNNIIVNDGPIAVVPSRDGLLFSNNLWSAAPPDTARGMHSLIQDPKLLRLGDTKPGLLTTKYFQLDPKSPARKAGMDLGDVVKEDVFGKVRAVPPTIGAYEIP